MSNIYKNVMYQFRLSHLSKHLYILFICFMSIIALYSFSQFKQLNDNIQSYKKDVMTFEKSGISEEKALLLENKKQQIKTDNGEMLTIEENPLQSSMQAVTMTLYSISPYYFLQNILEGATFLFFPLILSVYAIFISAQEYENKVIRIRAMKADWGKVMLSKLIFLITLGIGFIAITSLFAYLVANIQYRFIDDSILTKFMSDEYKVPFHIFRNICISALVSTVFIAFSVFFTTLIKKKFQPLLIVLLYLLVIPSLGIYDLKNVLMNFTLRYYPYMGTSNLANVKELPIVFCLIYCLALVLFLSALIFITSKRQSKYA